MPFSARPPKNGAYSGGAGTTQARPIWPGNGRLGRRNRGFSMRLAGKVALVTGAQQGIGAAIGRALAEEGADVALSWLDDQAGAEAVANYARQAGRRAHLIRADVARLADIDAMVAETVRDARRPRHPGQQRRRLSAREIPGDARERLGPRARHQPQGRLLRRRRRRQGADRGRQARLDHQPRRHRQCAARCAACTTARARAAWCR